MNILITGARAPVSVEFARIFAARGDTVFMADSLKHCVGRYCNSIEKYLVFPSPVFKFEEFSDEIVAIVKNHDIDLIIPMCEEIFFLAQIRHQIPCDVLSDEFEKIAKLHDKFAMTMMAGNQFAKVPQTFLIQSKNDLEQFNNDFGKWVLKPVHSRFASRLLISPKSKRVELIQPNSSEPWVCQQRIIGQEYSTYSVSQHGRLVAHCSYLSKYRAGVGSGIYFLKQQHAGIEKYVEAFVAQHEFTGQIGFDLMEDHEKNLWVIEANPRATSGAHFFRDSSDLAHAIVDANPGVLRPSLGVDRLQVMFAMPFWGVSSAIRQGNLFSIFIDFFRARDVLFRWNDVMPTFVGVPAALFHLWAKSRREKNSMQQASTSDIEFNGTQCTGAADTNGCSQ